MIERFRKGGVPAALLLAVAMGACSQSDASETEDVSTEVARVERGDLEIRVEASGQVEPILVIEVKSKASGEITNLLVETGDQVERGELLAEVDPRDVRNAYDQAEADLEVARARLKISESQASRSRDLREANVVTQQELEQAELDVANARAQMIKAQTSLQLAREKLSDVTIRAPISGTIIQKAVEAGQIIASASGNVSGGTTLMLMADLATMQVRTLVDETDIGKIVAGQPASVSVEAYPGRTFRGSVYKIEPQAVIDQNVTMFPVLVRLDNQEGLLKPNMNAEVQVDVASRADVVLVPNAAVVTMQEANAAGEVLGLSADAMRERMAMSRTRAAPASANGDSAAGNGQGAGAQPNCQALMAKARADRSSLTAEEQAQVRTCFQAMGGRRGAGRTEAGNGETRPAVVFVQTQQGPEPRMITLGLNDWDRSEVVRGLEEGEQVILISVARLRQAQESMMNRIRERNQPFGGR